MIEIKLKELIKEKGYEGVSYRKLSKEIGISHLPLWKMANGEDYNPSLQMLDKLCAFFDAQPNDLLVYKKR
ncbi:MAG: helix-turn-helix domain-containing protein [Deltaproteobacteria bacterium]|nr:MAG: helix-turn-helix domain-containing protein [Deltaproteobacteria bacterium]